MHSPLLASATAERSEGFQDRRGKSARSAAALQSAVFVVFLSGTVWGQAENRQAPHASTASRADLAVLRDVEPGAQGNQAASAAAERLAKLPSGGLIEVLKAFDGAAPRATNWLRLVAADVADNGPLPREELLGFFADRKNSPDARYLAFQLVVANDAGLATELLSGAADDPSLPVRYLAIERILEAAKEAGETAEATALYRVALENGRNPAQLKAAAKALNDRGEDVELAETMGFIRRWWVIGPFENAAGGGFDRVFAPEKACLDGQSPLVAVSSAEGKTEPVSWETVESNDPLGMVDLNQPFDDAKDATAYAWMAFEVDAGGPAQVRLGCINASKVWVNGEPIDSNEVYHSGSRIDQYIAPCLLRAGRNTILLKVCQNAQTESWAQDWQFQVRLTDPQGAALHPELKPRPR